jgi:hypothetical protein
LVADVAVVRTNSRQLMLAVGLLRWVVVVNDVMLLLLDRYLLAARCVGLSKKKQYLNIFN